MSALNKDPNSDHDRKNTLLSDVAFIKGGKEIQPESGIWMDEEARKKAQAAYIEEERQLMKKYQLAELEDIRKKIDGMGDAPLTEVKDMIKQHIEELENRQ